jgi:prepilin-type N-terminal cleavage/methylation domain-containing protein
VKRIKSGFTIVELLTVVAILALLIGVLLPALTYVRRSAKEAQQKVQLTTIDLALTTFKNDDGDYPRSDWIQPNGDYCGAQKLCEALLGWDLLGFHPKSAWRADGLDENGGEWTYDPEKVRGDDTLHERKGPYLELATANAFRLGNISIDEPGLFNIFSPLAPRTFVLCDVFGVRIITLANGKIVKAGTPILYYRANTSSKKMYPVDHPEFDPENSIYNAYDNFVLIDLGTVTSDGSQGRPHQLGDNDGAYFYEPEYKVIDPKVTARPWPYRPDSYILISAGSDGFYGTADDITNF